MLRQGAGLTTLQTIFDKLDYTQRLYGKIRLSAIRKNFSKGKIRNILDMMLIKVLDSHSRSMLLLSKRAIIVLPKANGIAAAFAFQRIGNANCR